MENPEQSLPDDYAEDLSGAIRAAVAASGRKLIALDDDPTGVQTVHDVPVLARWGVPDLVAELTLPEPLAFILTNSRSLPETEAIGLNREIASNLREASRLTGRAFALASRSDSTLRGHFPAETDALAETLGAIDGVLLVPAFFEGGRITIDDVHYVREGGRLVPAGETEFAGDATFGYRSSHLPTWIEEKTGGRVAANTVASLSLDLIRRGGPPAVAAELARVRSGQVVVVNAASERDLQVVALAVLQAEAAGRRFLYRTGASFVRARAGLSPRPLLTRAELVGAAAPIPLPGMVFVGSHVRRSSEQLARLLALPGTESIEVDVAALGTVSSRIAVIKQARDAAHAALAVGQTAVIFTSRDLVTVASPEAQLTLSRDVSAALVEIGTGIGHGAVEPRWIVAKGGITSSDIGTRGLGMTRAIVVGQVKPGVPVWRLGPETRFPGLPYVVFPGNVGSEDTLAEIVDLLVGRSS